MMYKMYSKGMIEIITGPMFSGKSEELIKRIKILGHANIKTLVVKPSIDKRWDKGKIMSRSGGCIDTIEVEKTEQILNALKKDNYAALAVDEIQFFKEDILKIITDLANKGMRIIVSGLDQDFLGKPFGVMPSLLAISDMVDKQSAICQKCSKAATMTFRKTKKGEKIQLGDNLYEPRCRECHYNGMK